MILKVNDRIKIRTIDYFTDFQLELSLNAIASTFSCSFYFDPQNPDHAELACVSHFHEVIVEHLGVKMLNGYIVSNTFTSNSKKQLVQIGGYSKSGILEDCDIPTSLYPLETVGLSLKEITERLIKKFGLKLVIESDATRDATTVFINTDEPVVDSDGRTSNESNGVNAVSQNQPLDSRVNQAIPKTTASESKNIKSYLTDLASQRNILISHNSDGNIVYKEIKQNQKPKVHFESGVTAASISMAFNGQPLHSHITCIKQADESGGNAGEFTIRNPFVPTLYRPKVVVQTSGDDISIQEFAQRELSKELKSIVVTISNSSWDIDGIILNTGDLITIKNPDIYLYTTTTFLIEKISFKSDSKNLTSVITCVLPCVYDGSIPKNIFVDAHQNVPRI